MNTKTMPTEATAPVAFDPEGPVVTALLDDWPPPTPGFHRIDLPGFNATLDLAVGEATWALAQWSGAADAWFLDGFSPALNPDMWSPQVLDRIAERSATDWQLGGEGRGLQPAFRV